MRLNECEQVKETLQKHLEINLTVVDGADLFLSRLEGIREPEKKRKVIGETFVCSISPSTDSSANWIIDRLVRKRSHQDRE